MYILEINQRIIVVKNVLVGHEVVAVVENVHEDLVVTVVAKNDHVDHVAEAEVKGIEYIVIIIKKILNCIYFFFNIGIVVGD